VLLGEKAETRIMPDGSKRISYFYPAQKMLTSHDFFKRLNNFELETIPQPRFQIIEGMLENENYNFEAIKKLSPCLHKLLIWVAGVVEFHRVVRNYSLSSYDYDILTQDEIFFCNQMDTIYILYYKLLRYANKFCKKYEKSAQNYLSTMG
jgi:hypothetical protein